LPADRAARSAPKLAIPSNRSGWRLTAVGSDPATDQPPDLVDAARGVLVPALIKQLQFGRQAEQQAQLVELQIDRSENPLAIASVGRPDQTLQQIERNTFDAIA
jgi:hypothetical protein